MLKIINPTRSDISNISPGDIIKVLFYYKELKPGAIWKKYQYIKVDYMSNNGSIKGRLYNNNIVWSSYNDNIISIIKAI